MRVARTVRAIAVATTGALLFTLLPTASANAGPVSASGATEVVAGALPAAVTAAQWKPGNIIADAVFYAPKAMSAAAVQTFLNSRGSSCVAGEQACLKNYRMTTPSRAAESGLCKAYTGATNETAAQIIAKVGQACGINPQVLLVLLQKETSLVTKSRPTTSNYNRATGYGCPDTGPNGTANCNTQYYGFFNQLYRAARQYLVYRNNPTRYAYQAGRTNTILYHPNTACGTKQVYIENQATAGLYIYTPYVPNAAALANFSGTGDSCSSYGNRNFFRIFGEWFGSTQNLDNPASLYTPEETQARALVRSLYQDLLGRDADAGGMSVYSKQLLAGRSVIDVMEQITASNEYIVRRVSQAYRDVLRRGPDAGSQSWVDAVKRGQFTVDDIAFLFYRTGEFYTLGGGNDASYVRHMYKVMLGREPKPAEVTHWVNDIRKYDRGHATFGVWFSMEAAMRRAGTYYRTFLGRSPDAAGSRYWGETMIGGGEHDGEGTVRRGFVGSAEYRSHALSRFPTG